MGKSIKKPSQLTLAESPLFSEAGVKFFTIYHGWLVAAVWLVIRGYALWGLSPNEAVQGYFEVAGDWLGGFIPYADFKIEYPPGALLLFVLPRFFTELPLMYAYGFAFVMLLADLGILLILWRISGLVPEGEVKDITARRYQRTLVCHAYLLLTAVFGRLLYQSYDLMLALVLVASIFLALRHKFVLVDVLLAVAVWLNLTALIWIPFFWLYGSANGNEGSGIRGAGENRALTPVLLGRAAVLAGSLAVFFLPFLVLSGRSLGHVVSFHLERGLQLESSVAGILMAAARVFNFEISTEATHRAIHLSGSPGSMGALLCTVLSVMIFVSMTVYLARRLSDQGRASDRGVWLIGSLMVTILAVLAASKGFLPQHLLWVCPLAALLVPDPRPGFYSAGGQLFIVNLLSVVVFFFYYPNLKELEFLPALLLLLRTFVLVWLVMSVLLSAMPAAQRREPPFQIPAHAKKYVYYLPLIVLFAWGTIAAFCPVSSNDLWLLLREAGDIVASGQIPRVDHYSAVAAGRPYLAHEWLSGLVFLGIFKLGGGQALTVLRASIMLAMLLLLWFSLQKRARSFVLTAPFLALAAYTILIRVFVRPHIFTLLFLCVWVFALERWRRQRRIGYLIILVPLQVLWANLHGGYIFAVLLGTAITGATALLVLRPGWSKEESYAWSDVLTLAVLTAACLAASLVNPHGVRLVEFSLNMGLASDFIKQAVLEWGSPFGPNYARSYGREMVLILLFLVWLGLALNLKQRPLVDAVLSLLATVMSVQAIRFIPYIAILGFPVMVRSWLAIADTYAGPLLVKRRRLLEAALFVLLLSSTLVYGFPYKETKHRKVGWGLGGRMPYQATQFMAEQGLEGNIYNDYGDGAFLIYYLFPKIRPVMDSRIDVYGSELALEYFASRENPVKFFQYLSKYNVSYILLRKSQKNGQILDFLVYIPATELLLETEDRLLFSYDPKRLPPNLMPPK